MACRYKLIIETATIRVPFTSVSETCSEPDECCTEDSAQFVCDPLNSDSDSFVTILPLCVMGWATTDMTGLEGSTVLDIQRAVIRNVEVLSTDCYVLECDDTVALDCEC